MKCPKCGREMELEEKDTSSGDACAPTIAVRAKNGLMSTMGSPLGRCSLTPGKRNETGATTALLICRTSRATSRLSGAENENSAPRTPEGILDPPSSRIIENRP